MKDDEKTRWVIKEQVPGSWDSYRLEKIGPHHTPPIDGADFMIRTRSWIELYMLVESPIMKG